MVGENDQAAAAIAVDQLKRGELGSPRHPDGHEAL
jgi:hypothetical protein